MEAIEKIRKADFENPERRVGATYVLGKGVYVRLWAPKFEVVKIQWEKEQPVSLQKEERGYFSGFFPEKKAGERYKFVADGKSYADPASRFQPEGVRGPSEVFASDHAWTDEGWKGVPYEEWVICEIHPGTYSPSHNFKGIIEDLPRLKDLGVNVIEILPVAQFPGERNWGYDGVFPHAVQNSYGGPEGLKALVDTAHAHGIAVLLDVVYNHLGPEGNVLPVFGHYFQHAYQTPWGDAMNFDGPHSEEVRHYFLQTVWQWLTEFHLDGLRLDAVHAIMDESSLPFLEEMARLKTLAENERGYPLYLIAEINKNDPRVLRPVEENGIGLDGQWADDLHHALHVMLTGEKHSYYADFHGLEQLERIYREGFAYQGEYSPFHERRHGRSFEGIDRKKFVVQTNNHDQIGNRPDGARMSGLVDFDRLKLMTAGIFLSPFTPFFFMGDEFALDTPFHYFVDFEGKELLQAIRKGRKEELGHKGEHFDPSSMEVFEQSVIQSKDPEQSEKSAAMYRLHKDLIALSKHLRTWDCTVERDDEKQHIVLHYQKNGKNIKAVLSFRPKKADYKAEGQWKKILDLSDYVPDGNSTYTHGLEIEAFSGIVLEKEE
jgi:maltooligosyltrehalose trehalohydrolase